MNDQEKALAALVREAEEYRRLHSHSPTPREEAIAVRLYASGVRVAPSPDAPGLTEALSKAIASAQAATSGAPLRWDEMLREGKARVLADHLAPLLTPTRNEEPTDD